MYWAKGTGFGTGSTQQSWDVEQALLRQKSEEEHVTVLLQVKITSHSEWNSKKIFDVFFRRFFLATSTLVIVQTLISATMIPTMIQVNFHQYFWIYCNILA